jgi:hypothetical protein
MRLKEKYVEQVLLQTEVEQLEGLVANMKSDLDELERGRAKSRFSQTWKGKIWSVLDILFSIYCVYKFIAVTMETRRCIEHMLILLLYIDIYQCTFTTKHNRSNHQYVIHDD